MYDKKTLLNLLNTSLLNESFYPFNNHSVFTSALHKCSTYDLGSSAVAKAFHFYFVT